MQFCGNCGTRLPDEADSCPECGHPRGVPGPGLPQRRNDSKAVASLVLGLLGLTFCPILVPSAIAIGLGLSARRRIRESAHLTGDGLATVGIVTGIVGLVWPVVLFLLMSASMITSAVTS